MTVTHFVRRTHLYLGLGLLPWVFIYGVSSIPFTHTQYFQQREAAKNLPQWTPRFERPLDVPVPSGQPQSREFGRTLLKELGVDGTNFNVNRQNPNVVIINSFRFLKGTRVTYAVDKKMVTVEDRRIPFYQILTGLHTRAGFVQDGFWQDSWGVAVDVVCVAMILWIITGYYMWWGVPGHRRWGWLTILAGAGSFVLFTLML